MTVVRLLLESLENSAYSFLIYSAVVLLLVYIAPVKTRPYVILLASMVFYGLCDLRFLGLLLLQTCITWWIGKRISEQKLSTDGDGRCATGWMIAGLVIIVGTLAIFKYMNFFISAVHIPVAEIVMPLGISYYSFREISYLADIRMRKRGAEESLLLYAAYVLFYPHMVCGPIARSERMLEQLKKGIVFDRGYAKAGFLLILSGMFKKVVLADRMSGYVNTVFSAYGSYNSLALWIAAVLYSLQLYCDFAGYSEIAVGLTKLFGLECDSNFNRPYLSQDMKEFWRRWHISLSSWLKDYIYIPLGGSRVAKWRTRCNVMIVFIVCGIWHGNSSKYVVWGIYQGILNVFSFKWRKTNRWFVQIARQLLVFAMAMFGWIVFRADSLMNAGRYIIRMFTDISLDYNAVVGAVLPFTGDNTCVAYFFVLLVMIVVLICLEREQEYDPDRYHKYEILRSSILLVLIILFGVTGTGSFLYANY